MPVDETPRAPSVPETLESVAARAPHDVAVMHRGRRRTLSRFVEDVARVAQGLCDLGVRPGQRVAIICATHAEAVTALHAVLRIGAVAVLHDPESTARELRRAFEDHSAVLAIADRQAIPALRALPADVHPKAVVAVDPPRSARAVVSGAVSHAARNQVRIVRRLRGRGPGPRPRPVDRGIPWRVLSESCPMDPGHPRPVGRDLALLQYGWGGDGELLGAMLTHENLVRGAAQLTESWEGLDDERRPVCATLPLHETAGVLLGALAPLLAGRPVVLAPDPDELQGALRKTRPAVVSAPPSLLLATATASTAARTDLAAVPMVLTSLEGTDPSVLRRWSRLTGTAPLVAEARPESGIAFCGAFDPEHPHRLGSPLGGVVVDVDADELRVAGQSVFHGYWNRPDETAHVLSGDGWVRTGLRVAAGVCRSDLASAELIGAAVPLLVAPDGRTVSPREVAATLMGHPDVMLAAVSGELLPDGGQAVRARARLRPGADCTAAELRDFVAARLAPVKVPREIELLAP